jgi:DNA-binding transcriptional ArsR family regulator
MHTATDPAVLDAKFFALADTTRRGLVERLSRGPSSVKALAEPIAMTLPTVLKHLGILESGGLVQSEKSGRVRTFRLAPGAFDDLERWVGERKRHWEQAFDRLADYLDETPPPPPRRKTTTRGRA